MTDLVLFSKLLHSVGLEQMANSRINHHTDGMDYLCLLRTPKLTVKLYCIRNTAKNANSGYLVHPHNHRYGFTSVLLSGELEHIRFEPKAVPDTGDSSLAYSKWIYHADTKNSAISERDTSMILQEKVEQMFESDIWMVNPYQVHTLRIKEGKEALIGLIQYEDVASLTDLYLPKALHYDDLPKVRTRTPTVDEFVELREKCINLFKSGVGMALYV